MYKRATKQSMLTLASHLGGVLSQPVGVDGTSLGVSNELVSLSESSGLLAGRGESSHLAVLHGGVADPVHLGVVPDGLCEVLSFNLLIL